MQSADGQSQDLLKQAHERAARLLGKLLEQRADLERQAGPLDAATQAAGLAALDKAIAAVRRMLQDIEGTLGGARASSRDKQT